MGVPTNFRDAECCLTCTHSNPLDTNDELLDRFLTCTKFATTCEDTTTCDEWEKKCDD